MQFYLGNLVDFDPGGDDSDGDSTGGACAGGDRCDSSSNVHYLMGNNYYPNNVAQAMGTIQREMAEMRAQTYSLKGTVGTLQVTVNRQQGEIAALKFKGSREVDKDVGGGVEGGETSGATDNWLGEEWMDAFENIVLLAEEQDKEDSTEKKDDKEGMMYEEEFVVKLEEGNLESVVDAKGKTASLALKLRGPGAHGEVEANTRGSREGEEMSGAMDDWLGEEWMDAFEEEADLEAVVENDAFKEKGMNDNGGASVALIEAGLDREDSIIEGGEDESMFEAEKADLEVAAAAKEGGEDANNEVNSEAFSDGEFNDYETKTSSRDGGGSHTFNSKKKKKRAGKKKKKKKRNRSNRRGKDQAKSAPVDEGTRIPATLLRIFGVITAKKLVAIGIWPLAILGLTGRGYGIHGIGGGAKDIATSPSFNPNKPGHHQLAHLNFHQSEDGGVPAASTDDHFQVTRLAPVLSPATAGLDNLRSSPSSVKQPKKRVASAPIIRQSQATITSSNLFAIATTQPTNSALETDGLEKTPCPGLILLMDSIYAVGSHGTMDGYVYEMCEDGWDIVGTCKDDVFMPLLLASVLESDPLSPSTIPSSAASENAQVTPLETYGPSSSPADPTLHPSSRLPAVTAPPSENIQGLQQGLQTNVQVSLPSSTGAAATDSSTGITSSHPTSIQPPESSTSASSLSSVIPTSSIPILEPQCESANPEVCGCANVNQTDYRGEINTTKSGVECARWNDDDYYDAYYGYHDNVADDADVFYHITALEDKNYCRNPKPDYDGGAWCWIGDGRWENCDVPMCENSLQSFPSSSFPSTSNAPSSLQEGWVSCGDHHAQNCAACPQEDSAGGCNGDCFWNGNSEQCVLATTPLSSSLISEPQCKRSNPQVCGCASVKQADYRGSINTTKSGWDCQRWDSNDPHENIVSPQNFPDAGLEDNFCRNPTGVERPWCYTMNPNQREENCDVPICPECPGGDTKTCGCGGLNQADYRGSISTTKTGVECMSWDQSVSTPKDNPGAGLEENFCRNPNPVDDKHAWCWKHNGETEHCEVPYCIPPLSSCSSPNSTNEDSEAACAYNRCIDAVDNGDDYFAKIGCQCAYEVWDCEFGSKNCQDDINRKNANDCCTNKKANDSNWLTKETSCKCIIIPDCEEGDADKCIEAVKHCCGEDDQECKCEYQTKACYFGLEEEFYCLDAEKACCGNNAGHEGCSCTFWDTLCNDHPNSNIWTLEDDGSHTSSTCEQASSNCCMNPQCQCDFFIHAIESMEYEDPKKMAVKSCVSASSITHNRNDEVELLQSIYNKNGGEHWSNNNLWMTNASHCEWHGILCDNNGYVTEIKLESNKLTGKFPSNFLSNLFNLKYLDLSDNKLWGVISGTNEVDNVNAAVAAAAAADNDWVTAGIDHDISAFFYLKDLAHVDLSRNNLGGEADVLFAPALEHVNFSHNNFTSVNSFKKFKQSHKILRICDLSFNSIQLVQVRKLMKNLPPNLEQLLLSNNQIQGTFPKSLERLVFLRDFHIESNKLSGELPDFSTPFPNLQELNLSNQRQGNNTGLIGTIPESLSNLQFLSTLNFAGNSFDRAIPPVLGNLAQLNILDLSNNKLSNSIPSEFGKLKGSLEVINFSDNMLMGSIPSEMGQLEDASVVLNGNEQLEKPAPLSLCLLFDFDLKYDTDVCPTERNVLKEFYDLSKGQEWTENLNWENEYSSYCDWKGVTCDTNTNKIIMLNLTNNGLSGKLSKSIGNLSSLEVLDLSDNDIKGSIPSEIGLLSNLIRMRLAYNSFIGNVPEELGVLPRLNFVQLQSNRLSGKVPVMNLAFVEASSFVTDCGVPSALQDPLECEDCTMCCNSQEDCYPTEEPGFLQFELRGFEGYIQFSWVFFLCVVVLCFILAWISSLFDKHKNENVQVPREQELKTIIPLGLELIGTKTIHRFFLTANVWGLASALAVMGAQLWALFIFVVGSEFDLQDDTSRLIYTYRCSRDQENCDKRADLDWQGWTVFAILMSAHLLKDLINGGNLITLSGRRRFHTGTRLRLFFGGFILNFITSFTLYVSTIYNAAIATSNTELIENVVIILFITDLDELFYGIFMAATRLWENGSSADAEEESHDEQRRRVIDDTVDTLKNAMDTLQDQNTALHTTVNTLQEQNTALHGTLDTLQGALGILQEQNTKLNNAVHTLQKAGKTLQHKNSSLCGDVQKLFNEVAVLKIHLLPPQDGGTDTKRSSD